MKSNPEHSLIARSPTMSSLLNTVDMLSGLSVPVMIVGEAGSGRTRLARYAIAKSVYSDFGIFYPTTRQLHCLDSVSHCQTIEHAMEAVKGKTLLIEHCEHLPVFDQTILLEYLDAQAQSSALQQKHVESNVRIIATMTKQNHLMNDYGVDNACFHRLSQITWHMPSLRDRAADIPELVRQFAQVFAEQLDCEPCTYSASAMKQLKAYVWPGNVQELSNVCMELTTAHAGQVIQAEHLPKPVRMGVQSSAYGSLDLSMMEFKAIQQALLKTAGNKSQAAKLLGLSRDALNYRLKKHGLT